MPDTKTTILETARRLFHEQGYEATGIAQILKAADINSGSLYHFFPSKEALLLGVLESHLELLASSIIDEVERATADPIERVFALMAHYRRTLESSASRLGCPVGNLAIEVRDAPQVRRLIDTYFDRWAGHVEAWLLAAGDRLPADTDRGALARLVLSVTQGAILQARSPAATAAFDASLSQLRMYFNLLEERA